jgi:hypothetical protein
MVGFVTAEYEVLSIDIKIKTTLKKQGHSNKIAVILRDALFYFIFETSIKRLI